MEIKALKDAYVNALVNLLIAVIPFLTIGLLGLDAVLYLSACIGTIILVVCIIRMIYCMKIHKINETTSVTKTMVSYYLLPYVFLLSYLIMKLKEVPSEFTLWFSVIWFVLATPVVVKELMKK